MKSQRKPLGMLDPNITRIQPSRVAKKEHKYFATRRSKEFSAVENKNSTFQINKENNICTNFLPSQKNVQNSRNNYYNNLNQTEGIQRVPLQTLVTKKNVFPATKYQNYKSDNIRYFSPLRDSPNSSLQSMSTDFDSDASFQSQTHESLSQCQTYESQSQDEISYLFSTSAAVDSPDYNQHCSEKQKRTFDLLRTSSNKSNEILETDEYCEEVLQHLMRLEGKYLPKPHYLDKQREVTPHMRTKLIDWMVEVQDEYKLEHETFQLAVAYVDIFLSTMSVTRAKLQLLGTSCMFLGAKYEEIYPPDADEFAYVTADTYTREEVLLMERLLLKTLKFRISVPTTHQYLDIFHSESSTSEDCLNLSFYLSDLMLLDEKYLKYSASVRAASSFTLSIATIHHSMRNSKKNNNDNTFCFLDNGQSNNYEGKAVRNHPVSIPCKVKKGMANKLPEIHKCTKDLANTHSEEHLRTPQCYVTEKYTSEQYNFIGKILPLLESVDALESTELWDRTVALWLT